MKKISLVLMTFFLVALTVLPLTASAAAKTDFRNVKWGMSEKQVRKLEKDKLITSDTVKKFSYLTYSSIVSSKSSEVSYLFYNNKLVRTITMIGGNSRATGQERINDYHGVKDALTDKFGKPTNSSDKYIVQGKASSLTNDDELDLMQGNILFKSRWLINNNKTEVTLHLDIYQSESQVRILYTDRTNNLNIDKLIYADSL